jgi:hypothetical protein
MATVHPGITPDLAEWITAQPVFFVATAPLSSEDHINVSPRGLDTFRILGPGEAAYLDLTGSGNESAAHVAENRRITLMFCAFSGPPRILRLYGRGEVVLPGDPGWRSLRAQFPAVMPGERQIMRIEVTRVQTSCGFGVPLFEYVGQRDTLTQWALRKGPQGLKEYWATRNASSIDGLAAPPLGNNDVNKDAG